MVKGLYQRRHQFQVTRNIFCLFSLILPLKPEKQTNF
jgi:hypothetical protein